MPNDRKPSLRVLSGADAWQADADKVLGRTGQADHDAARGEQLEGVNLDEILFMPGPDQSEDDPTGLRAALLEHDLREMDRSDGPVEADQLQRMRDELFERFDEEFGTGPSAETDDE